MGATNSEKLHAPTMFSSSGLQSMERPYQPVLCDQSRAGRMATTTQFSSSRLSDHHKLHSESDKPGPHPRLPPPFISLKAFDCVNPLLNQLSIEYYYYLKQHYIQQVMGCASSKSTAVKADTYLPAPSSFAVFDINSIKEPWLVVDHPLPEEDQDQSPSTPPEKPAKLPATILDKLNKLETADDAPHSAWVDVKKALEDLKSPAVAAASPKPAQLTDSAADKDEPQKPGPKKNHSFHTLEELDTKLASPKPAAKGGLRKTESLNNLQKAETRTRAGSGGGVGRLKENIFIQKDREEREKEGKLAIYDRLMATKRDPFSEFPEKCPPRGEASLVIYTTSLHGVRRTYEDCNRARSILEVHRVVFDERDVSLHGEFLTELRELLGEGAIVPQVFVKGRHLGGVDDLVEINETGRFHKMLTLGGIERGPGRLVCEGCGGARFVPCLDCGGSCKVVVGSSKVRCGFCNENGLVHCPACL